VTRRRGSPPAPGEEEIQHGENGFLILDHYVNEADTTLQKKCVFFIDALSRSMAYGS
jgi:hypothetical protein